MGKKLILGFQHVLAMFGATVLVPILTGLSIPVALFFAGVGTLVFHFVTKKQVPVFLGSSFAFIGGIVSVKEMLGMEYATGAILVASSVYFLAALIVKVIGTDKFVKLFPPIVISPIILVIGLILSPTAVGMASSNWFLAIVTIVSVLVVGIFAKGFFKTIPILSGLAIGYLVSVMTGNVDFAPVLESSVLAVPGFHLPKFDIVAISIIAPIALVTIVEHIGDVTANGSVVGRNFIKKPGLHRTLLGDGLASFISGMFGGPANTTYGENTGTLAVTKVYEPSILRIAAVMAIVLSFFGSFAAIISTIPQAVMGGISFILFGMIANIGVKQLVDNKVDLGDMKNSIVFFAPVIIGISSLTASNPAVIAITEDIRFSGLSLAAITAILLNVLLSVAKKRVDNEG